ncbi:hypothetical protein ASPACDRAFT_2735, partial [Aspergillus aculeatus ATCC 16872]
MDAFKLLTRATKLKTGTASSTLSSSTLPSKGKAQTPQLFHASEAEELLRKNGGVSASKKRKRTHAPAVASDSENDDDNLPGLDFFGAGKSSASTAKKERAAAAKGQEEVESEEEEGESMDEVQRRTILNTHKIKVTDMRDLEGVQQVAAAAPPAEGDESNKKKTKKRKQEKESSSSAQPLTKKELKKARQLFPQPLVSFKELRTRYNISRRLAENIAEQGFTVPTEVQLGSLPLLLGDQSVAQKAGTTGTVEPDLLVVAPTGSGKTLSFMIPVINKIVRHHHQQQEERGIFAVVVAPTKELASQIVNEGRKLALGTGVKITLMKKGMRKSSKGKAPVTKSDILVTTPLMLVNALSANKTKPLATLPLVRNIVLDEADVLLDPLFREQTLDIWRACTHPELRASLWSATMGSNIEDLAKSTIKERKDMLSTTKSYPLLRLVVGLKDSAIPNIKHKLVYAATEQGKLLGLRQLLHPAAAAASDVRLRPPFLIFTQTIPRAIALHSELRYDIPAEAGGSSRIAVLHSDLSDNQRSDIMRLFRKGEIWILVTTDLLARGVDFRGINGVVNYDIPNSAAVYVHRVGRTGRAGREGGIAVTYYTKEDIPYVKSIANVIDVSEKLRGTTEEKSVQKWLLDALPDLSKKSKQELKKHGVKARQSKKDGKEDKKTRISTKSGYERRMENKRKGAIEASRTRKSDSRPAAADAAASDNEAWDGLDD